MKEVNPIHGKTKGNRSRVSDFPILKLQPCFVFFLDLDLDLDLGTEPLDYLFPHTNYPQGRKAR